MSKHNRGYLRGQLTAAFVRSVTKPGKYHDKTGMGLMLRVSPSGSRRWVQRLVCNGKRIEIGLGGFPIVTLAEARERAIENKRLAYNGHNLVERKSKMADIPTFQEAAAEAVVILSHGKAPKYDVRFMGALNLHVIPHIGSAMVTAISRAELNRLFEPLITEKPGIARKVIEHTSAVFKWCVGKGFIDVNPMDNARQFLPKIKASGKHRASLPYDQVTRFLRDLHASGASVSTKLGIEFLILTAGRSIEIRGAVWDEIDLTKNQWIIPAGRMKARKEHIVPLSDRALEILQEARSLAGTAGDLPVIFPSPRGGIFSDVTFSKLVKTTLGYPVDVHGFRTSFRTWSQEKTSFSEEACELALAHVFGDETRNAYAQSNLLDERARLMQQWADYVKAAAG